MAEIVKGWRWVAEPDACEFCQERDGSEHALEEDMETHPNCRCTQEPIVVNEEVFTSFEEFREFFKPETIQPEGLQPRLILPGMTELINRIWETDSFNIASQFRSGDIIALLRSPFGNVNLIKSLVNTTGLSLAEINRLASGAARFTVSFREKIFDYLATNNLTLTFDHFIVVKQFDDNIAEFLLKRAADNHWTAPELREFSKRYK